MRACTYRYVQKQDTIQSGRRFGYAYTNKEDFISWYQQVILEMV